MGPVSKKIRIALDVVMLILLMLMYRKMAISMAFHEIGGLALIALFILHHIVNGKWTISVTKRLTKKETPAKTKVQYVLSVLLLLDFLLILLSGILMSKVVFSFGVHGGAWKTIHYFCAALAVILSGVHLGLHGRYLFGALLKRPLWKISMSVLLAAVLAFGVYSMTTTSFGMWLSMPFDGARQGQGRGQGGQGYGSGGSSFSVEDLPAGEGVSLPEATAAERPGQGGSGPHAENGKGDGREQAGSVGQILRMIAGYCSIAAVFGALTAFVEWLTVRSRKEKKRCPPHKA